MSSKAIVQFLRKRKAVSKETACTLGEILSILNKDRSDVVGLMHIVRTAARDGEVQSPDNIWEPPPRFPMTPKRARDAAALALYGPKRIWLGPKILDEMERERREREKEAREKEAHEALIAMATRPLLGNPVRDSSPPDKPKVHRLQYAAWITAILTFLGAIGKAIWDWLEKP